MTRGGRRPPLAGSGTAKRRIKRERETFEVADMNFGKLEEGRGGGGVGVGVGGSELSHLLKAPSPSLFSAGLPFAVATCEQSRGGRGAGL